MTAPVTFKLRRATASAWTTADPVLAAGEPGIETDTARMKVGNGVGVWSALSYIDGPPSGGGSDIVGAAAAMTAVAVNNAAYQVLATKSITVAAGDQIEIEVIGTYQNNSGGTVTPRTQIALGAFTCESIEGVTIAASATNRSTYRITGRFVVASVSSAGATLWNERNVPAAANTANSIALTTIRPSFNTSGSNLTGAQTIEVRMRSSTGTATQTFTVFSWRVRKTAAV